MKTKNTNNIPTEYVCEKMIENYQDNITKAQLLCLELRNIDSEAIEQLCLPAVVLSSLPKSITNKITSSTERVAETYEREKKEYLKEINRLSRVIEDTETLLNSLDEKERFVIEKRLLQRNSYNSAHSWNEIARLYTEKFESIGRLKVREIYKVDVIPKLEKRLNSKKLEGLD